MKTARQLWIEDQNRKSQDKVLAEMAEEERQERRLERKMARKHGQEI